MSDQSIEPANAPRETAKEFIEEFEVLDRPEYGHGHFTLMCAGPGHVESN